jgi:3-methyl-2-oxobutanoate hydroxymethyltransferase
MKGKAKVVCVTAYDAIFAALADKAGVDLILVGDSVGTTMLGYSSTIPVTFDMMAHHTAAVARSKPNALVVLDMPFGVATHSFDRLLDACVRTMQECGADGVKIEGGYEYAPVIEKLTCAGVPVMGHIGLLPQRVNQIGCYRKFGKTPQEVDALIKDAQAVGKAGAFCIVGEMIAHDAARIVAESVKVPLIGIGSGPHCDGQILVMTDLLGLTQGNVPSFAKRYADLGTLASTAFGAYAKDVREGAYPPSETPKQENK